MHPRDAYVWIMLAVALCAFVVGMYFGAAVK